MSPTDEGLRHLPKLRELRSLALEGDFSDATLDQVGTLDQLTHLSLDCPKVTDAGLLQVGQLVELRELTLKCPKISDAGLQHLAELVNLEELNITSSKVSWEEYDALKKSLPELELGVLKSTN